MKTVYSLSLLMMSILLLNSCGSPEDQHKQTTTAHHDTMTTDKASFKSAYATVNGIKMYYEIHGSGKPLLLLHGGGSTINTCFSRMIPLLAPYRQVIAVELQAHGRTEDRNTPETFDQDAADVIALMKELNISKADVLGFSNGGQTAMVLGMNYPQQVNKLVIASAFYKREGTPEGFWKFMEHGTFNDMPQIYKDEYLKVNNSQEGLVRMHDQDANRMRNFKGWTDAEIQRIKAPSLIVLGDKDLPTLEHAGEMNRNISNSRLLILPGDHGSYMGEAMSWGKTSRIPEAFAQIVNDFLDEGPAAQPH